MAVLPLNAFRVAVTNKKGEDPTIKDGQMFGKGKTVTLFPVQKEKKEKKNKKKVKSKESGGEEAGKSEDDDSAKTRVDEETAGPVVNGPILRTRKCRRRSKLQLPSRSRRLSKRMRRTVPRNGPAQTTRPALLPMPNPSPLSGKKPHTSLISSFLSSTSFLSTLRVSVPS